MIRWSTACLLAVALLCAYASSFVDLDTFDLGLFLKQQRVFFSTKPSSVGCADIVLPQNTTPPPIRTLPPSTLPTNASTTHNASTTSLSTSLPSAVDDFSWVDVSTSELLELLTKEEYLSIPVRKGEEGVCDMKKMAEPCCLGTISAGGGNRRYQERCYGGIAATQAVYTQRFPIPYHRVFRIKGKKVLYDMKDVLLAARSKTVVFLGDSVMNQIFDGILCAIQRRTGAVLTLVRHERPRKKWFFGTGTREVLKVDTTNTTVVLHREFRFHPSGLTVKEVCVQADILVVNFGLHWNNMREYSKDMKSLASFLKKYCVPRGVQLIFRGSTSQHFFSENGRFASSEAVGQQIKKRLGPEYFKNYTDGGKRPFAAGCTKQLKLPNPSRDDIAMNSFRAQNFTVIDVSKHSFKQIQHIAATSVNPVIKLIPLGKITQDLYEFHYNECTHFCSTPLIWQPIVHYLYKAIGNEYLKNCSQLYNPKPWKNIMAKGMDFQIPELAWKNSSIYKNRRRQRRRQLDQQLGYNDNHGYDNDNLGYDYLYGELLPT